ncbi:hypothetical protein M422DRAFT_257860 [Sphaerobolus stellatus SS14]|uniref:Uncharacterized protein n=1 Tax=Sphaerobolus stellatus (strain SS14) TaxID=990650 RepID=A0A0C9UWM1_SPHS4|nr:hypothetical protein M422DRAFT_257860 [Sphaerobolus stellatus SS14]
MPAVPIVMPVPVPVIVSVPVVKPSSPSRDASPSRTPTPPPSRTSTAVSESDSSSDIYHLLPLPSKSRPRPQTPLKFPPIASLPRSPYRPHTPPAHPTSRIRIVPNPAYLRIKAMQNRVCWGLVELEREEGEALRRLGLFAGWVPQNHMSGGEIFRDKERVKGAWEVIDREGRMCSGREARVGVAVEGRRGSLLREGEDGWRKNTSKGGGWWKWVKGE